MKGIKRKLNLKKFRGKNERHSIENFSNEIFYEIFDYLDGCDIFYSFSNLNFHIQQILSSSSLLLKIKFHSPDNDLYKNFCKQIINVNKYQIYSLDLDLRIKFNDFFSLFSINSSLVHLKSLTLCNIPLKLLLSILVKLRHLSYLISLTIDIYDVKKSAANIYQKVFKLPSLRKFDFSVNNSKVDIKLPFPKSTQYSSIEYLTINHCCSINELSSIVSYTPQLHYLDYMNFNFEAIDIKIISPIILSNLTHCHLCTCALNYEDFEKWISQTKMKLKSFTLITLSDDVLYFNANQWEMIIRKYLSDVKVFNFGYNEYMNYDFQSSDNLGEKDQFLTPFWIERCRGLDVTSQYQTLLLSICQYQKRWYEYNTTISFPDKISKSTRLILKDLPPLSCQEILILYIERALTAGVYYHLEILEKQIFIGVLIRTIDRLPELLSLRIHSLSCDEPRELYDEELDIIFSTEEKSKITKVYLERMIEMTDIDFIMDLCPYMEYLKIGWMNDMDAKLFVQVLLKKIKRDKNKYLRLLCFHVRAADEQIIKKLEKMIDSKKLLINYKFKRVRENIYLQWE